MYAEHIGWTSSKLITRIIRLGSSLLIAQHRQPCPSGTPLKFGWNRGGVVLSRKHAISLKWGKIGPRLLSMTNRKWCYNRRPWMTLKGHYALRLKTRASFGAHHKNLNEDRLHCQRRWCSPMTLDSHNIRLMRIFAGVPWKGGVIQQWGNRKRVFCRFRTLRIGHLRKWGQCYYIVLFSPLSPFHWHQNPWPWMTLNCLKGHFTLYVHYYERPLAHYLLLI